MRQHIRPLPRLGILEEDVISMRVWPNDIDLNLHMNNARYLSVMDFSRTHFLARTGLLDHILHARWQPLVGAAWVTYRRSLLLLARFTLSARLVCWDERWFYLEQIFTGSRGQAAVGWVKGALRGSSGLMDPRQVIEGIEPGLASPPLPEAFAAWNELTREHLHAGNGS